MADISPRTIAVWDPLIRIGHWLIVACFIVAYLTEGRPEWLHSWAGYLIAITVALRVVWGFVGPGHARFSNFVTSPGEGFNYLLALFTGRAKRHVGHSPAGGLMTLALLFMLAVITVSGMATLAAQKGHGPLAGIVAQVPRTDAAVTTQPATGDDEDGDGERRDPRTVWKEVHELAVNFTLLLIVLHVAGVVVASVAHRENLARSMVTGRKRAP